MTNLESFENFKNEEVENSEALFGGQLFQTVWTDGSNSGKDVYDSTMNRISYYQK